MEAYGLRIRKRAENVNARSDEHEREEKSDYLLIYESAIFEDHGFNA
jgi:hypothetical protein